MAETTQDWSFVDNIFAVFSNLDADLRFLNPSSPDKLVRSSSPAVSTDPEVIVISPPNFPVTSLYNPASTDGQHSPDSTSTIEASENDIIIDIPPPADIELLANNSNEEQHELPPAYPLPTDSSRVLSRPNQFKHRTETANLVNSRQHRREQFASKPTTIIRPRINSRLRYGLKPEIDSWNYLLGYPTKRTDFSEYILTISTTCGSPTGCHCSPSSRRMTNWCDPKTIFDLPKLVRPKTPAILPSAPQSRTSSLPLEAPNHFSSFFSGWVIALQRTLKPQKGRYFLN